MLILDVDGVMTSGQLFYGENKEIFSAFNILDGLGIEIALRSGLEVVILTRRTGEAIVRRAEKLGVKKIYRGVEDKKEFLEKIKQEHHLLAGEICYIGDDLIDLGCLRRVGVPVAVSNACPEVKEAALYITQKKGGEGAVREVIELILKAQHKWSQVVRSYE